MSADLFVVSGVIDEIKIRILSLEKVVMEEPNSEDIDWEKAISLAEAVQESAEILQDEINEEIE